ncbi:MAG: DUF3073 domain-containing protein [Actinomycetota bacterium]
MGRGRAKAKQQKVARDLKYNAHPTDLDALQRELRGADQLGGSLNGADADELADDDEYDQDDWASVSR